MTPVFGLYSHIQANRIRSVLLLAGLFLLVYAVLYAVCILITVQLGDYYEQIYNSDMTELGAILDMALERFWTYLPFATLGVGIWIVIGYFGHQALIDGITERVPFQRRRIRALHAAGESMHLARPAHAEAQDHGERALNAYASGMYEKQFCGHGDTWAPGHARQARA